MKNNNHFRCYNNHIRFYEKKLCSQLLLSTSNRKAAMGIKFSCLVFQQSVARTEDIVQAIWIKRVVLQFRWDLSICKIEFWCELTIDVIKWKNLDLCFGQTYLLTSRLRGKGHDLDAESTFRREFLICECSLTQWNKN